MPAVTCCKRFSAVLAEGVETFPAALFSSRVSLRLVVAACFASQSVTHSGGSVLVRVSE